MNGYAWFVPILYVPHNGLIFAIFVCRETIMKVKTVKYYFTVLTFMIVSRHTNIAKISPSRKLPTMSFDGGKLPYLVLVINAPPTITILSSSLVPRLLLLAV